MQNKVYYPLGIQTFEKIINEDFLYVDKTDLIYQMTHGSRYVFLSRPRRFGKSLLVSTLKSYFEGRQDLFRGLAIEKLEKDWIQYPIIRIDLSGGKHLDKEALVDYLIDILDENAKSLDINAKSKHPNIYLKNLIVGAHEKYQKPAVLLIDEYDAPLLDVIHEDERLEDLRRVMQNFYSPIKKNDEHLRFVFITGITKFSQLSIFSELNNLNNISMVDDYAAVCGITEQEMIERMDEGIDILAHKYAVTKDEMITKLKDNYDGYHFSPNSPDIYNPFSLLAALTNQKISAYWFGSGTPSFLINLFDKFNVTPAELGEQTKAVEDDFDMPAQKLTEITPLLYQSGYFTIKDYEPESEFYTLGIPNREIRIGLFRNLLSNYVGPLKRLATNTAVSMSLALAKDDIDQMLKLLKEYLGTIPYVDNVNKSPEAYEGHWQQLLYIIFTLLGAKCAVEVHTQKGRVDMVARSASTLYLFELKLNKSAEAALKQIDLKNYEAGFALSGLPIVKVGINFDVEERNITEWKIAPAN